MPLAPTTSLDLTAPEVIADPYPFLAAEREQHAVAWHEPSQSWLTFTHATVSHGATHPHPGPAVDRPGTARRRWSRSTCSTATR